MGDAGDKTLGVYFGEDGDDNRRVFNLLLDGVDSGTYAFQGNINAYAGKGWADGNEAKNGKFVGVFGGKGVKGNITIGKQTASVGNPLGFRNQMLFKNGANLEGNITTMVGKNTFVFENGNIKRNISANAIDHVFSYGGNIFVFKGKGNKIEGDISSSVSPRGGGGTNTITFENGGNISTNGGGGRNTINLHATNNTITGNISSSIMSNTLNVSGDSFTLVDNISSQHSGLVINNGYGTNELNLNAANNTIKGSIIGHTAKNYISSTGKLNIIKGSGQTNIKMVEFNNRGTFENNIKAKELNIDIDNIVTKSSYGGSNNNIITADYLTLTADNIATSVDWRNTDPNRITITTTGGGSIEVNRIHAATGFNTFNFTGGYTKLTVSTSIEAGARGINSFVISNAGLYFDTNNKDLKAIEGGNNDLILKQGGKFITPSQKLTFQNLIFDGAKFDKNQAGQNTLAQSNTIVDLATSGKDLLELDNRKAFRLLTIGTEATPTNGNITRPAKGLIGSNGFFRIYVNRNATSGSIGGESGGCLLYTSDAADDC